MEMQALIALARENQDFSGLIAEIPYARLIGMQSIQLGDELLFVLPPQKDNIGNPTLPAIHGGCLGGFMEKAALLHVLATAEAQRMPKVIDFSLDFIRPGRYRDTYASCEVVRQGRNVANVSVTAWQTRSDTPIANARTHLLL